MVLGCDNVALLGTSLYCAVHSVPLARMEMTAEDSGRATTMIRSTLSEEIGGPESVQSQLSMGGLWVVCVAACALSVVAGFVSLLPGGAGVRELVLMVLLIPIVGNAAGLIVAIVHRMATIIGELAIAGLSLFAEWSYKTNASDAKLETR